MVPTVFSRMDGFTVPGAIPNTCPGHATGFPAAIFTQFMQTIMTAHCALGNSADYPPCYGDQLQSAQKFDFIVVGAGKQNAAHVVSIRVGTAISL